jgi:parallel beta-helix repeat protein
VSDRRFRLKLDGLEIRATPATLRVDDDLTQFPNAKYQSIQAAVDAAGPNDTIVVYPGTYAEKVRVGTDKFGNPRNLTGLTLRSQTPLAATITLPADAPDFSAIVTIDYVTGIDVNGFTIAGPGQFAGQVFSGLEVNHRASVTVRNNLFRDIGDPPTESGPSGNQTGFAVYVGYDGGGTATVRNNTFVRYQKVGILVDGPHSSATIDNNTLTGYGPTPAIAQIGVQVSNNATATVTDNTITGHAFTGPGSGSLPLVERPGKTPQVNPLDNPVAAAGVVVYQAGAVTVARNGLFSNQVGVYVWDQSNTTVVQKNTVAGSTQDGIVLDLARGSVTVARNTVDDSGRDGIQLRSNSHNNTVTRNTVTDSGRFGISSVPFQYGADPNYDVVAPANNVIAGNTVTGSVAFDLFAQSAPGFLGGDGINDLWSGNTFGTRNRPGLR